MPSHETCTDKLHQKNLPFDDVPPSDVSLRRSSRSRKPVDRLNLLIRFRGEECDDFKTNENYYL